jgi:hypothetical protein
MRPSGFEARDRLVLFYDIRKFGVHIENVRIMNRRASITTGRPDNHPAQATRVSEQPPQ